GLPIPGFEYPQASNSFSIDPIKGDLIWDSPELQGEYNVAFIIEEWRNGQRIGYVTRDLQIKIIACANNPPIIETIDDTCVEAGEFLTFPVTAYDPDGDDVLLTAIGSPFEVLESPAQFILIETDTAIFEWNTKCSHVRKYPHTTYFKASDDNDTLNLVAYKTVNITIVAPAPENPLAEPLGNRIDLTWDNSFCPNAIGYRIYRKSGFYGFIPDHCETGVPAYTGYSLIKTLEGINNTSLSDDNNGAGLNHGIEYCYMIISYFQDGAESYASEEVCATLKKDIPIITHVNVEETNETNGQVYVEWSMPTELDFTQTPGPFLYELFRTDNSPDPVEVNIASFTELEDTIFIDSQLNTRDYSFTYHIDFYNNQVGNTFMIGSTQNASSIYLNIAESDKILILDWSNDVPWKNEEWEILRYDENSQNFELLGTSDENYYTDTGLINGTEYCYKIKSIGSYSAPGLVNPIINFSQINCGKPVDNVPPCEVTLNLQTNCDLYNNYLTWEYPDSCVQEDLLYYIYYAPSSNDSLIVYDSTTVNSYLFETFPQVIVGCFAITTLDSLWNESGYSNIECVDLDYCGRYRLPNIITPNGDHVNDLFMPFPPKEQPFIDPPFPLNSVFKVKITIFNRWGTIVFETDDPFILWDGKDQTNSQLCSDGVYYYVCDVYERTLTGSHKRILKGSITLLR
ncbi:MAG: gliding motility-associated C-terminal domain-containing protein, partial [Bacteroidales bacterium]|nr:gliding motility-associated C-terminal domain-containing protein [Bacteroidales bacterium]